MTSVSSRSGSRSSRQATLSEPLQARVNGVDPGNSVHMTGMEDRARGQAKELKGQAKEAAGRATGDPGLRARGEADQAKGRGRGLLGRFKTFLARR